MKVLRGLGLPEDDSRAFVLIDGTEFLISVFDEPPLSPKFPATRELLTPHPKTGMYVSGFSITGQPVHNFVFQHDKNAAKHGLVLGVTRGGKTQVFAVTMAAESNAGQIMWLSSCFKDEKTATLGEHIDRQGISPIYMARPLRAAKALCQIRAEMPWAYDGKPHDDKPGDDRCPYKQLNVYADEFMTASQDPTFGDFIQADGDAPSVGWPHPAADRRRGAAAALRQRAHRRRERLRPVRLHLRQHRHRPAINSGLSAIAGLISSL
ncbi:hypothetical protein [Streptomyces sp. NPDC056690]|uniref:hypothetical protein n=1 Tax=Streptomyces sp. NPDC056690 TaxID=3345912 RepID=UPI00369B6F37